VPHATPARPVRLSSSPGRARVVSRTLVLVLALGLTGLTGVAAGAAEAGDAGGTLTASDGTLRRGCHTYSFRYAVEVPYDDWMLETSVRDRRGRGVASHAFLGPYDPRSQRVTYRLCRGATRAGRFTITGTLVAYDDPDRGTTVRLPPESFRLRRR
jgi:hypothetical protein